MYSGPIGEGIWGRERGWCDQSEFNSDKFYEDTLESLEQIVRENHPILERIRSRESDVKRLAENYPAREEDIPEEDRTPPDAGKGLNALARTFKLGYYSPYNKSLESMLEKECEENGEDSERAQELRAAINWKENADEIKRLKDEYNEAYNAYFAVRYPKTEEEKRLYNLNREKVTEAESSLRREIQKAVARDRWGDWYEDWDKDYDFRRDFEGFLSDIVRARQNLRAELSPDSVENIRELVQKYLENPLWHLPQITNFLLEDLIDSDLIIIEKDFYFGLFAPYISDEIEGAHSTYMPFWKPFQNETPCLAPKAKEARRKRRLKHFLIGGGLTFILRFPLEGGERIINLWINEGLPSWIVPFIWVIAAYLILPPINGIVWEYITKRRMEYKSIFNQAHNLLNIRWDIYSGTYDAKTCIERLKKLDDQDLHISSLIYPLLELQITYHIP